MWALLAPSRPKKDGQLHDAVAMVLRRDTANSTRIGSSAQFHPRLGALRDDDAVHRLVHTHPSSRSALLPPHLFS